MDKYIFVLTSVLMLVVLMNLRDVAAQKNSPTMEECKAAEKATDEDIENMKKPGQAKTKPMKCLITCLAEKSGKISKNQFVPEVVVNATKALPNYNDQMQKSLDEVVVECKKIKDADRCEFGAKTMNCLLDESAKRKISDVFSRLKSVWSN